MITSFIEFLRARRNSIVTQHDVLQQIYDPTYGPRDTTVTINNIDFDALCDAIDEFAETFKESQ